MIGQRFGPFEVIGLLGAGGMGEVYRARDARLGRDVAIKVLPAAFAADHERLARFEREARALAAVSHPNIGAIYGLERADGRPGLVLELVEGQTLSADVGAAGSLVAARARSQADIWMFPVGGSAADNMRQATRLTHQSGQVQTPSVSPDGTEFIYVSDHGGHGNLWIAALDGSPARQLTFEREKETIIGVAQWSPAGDRIAFIAARRGQIGLRLIAPDGSGQCPLVDDGFSACWSNDGRWVYFTRSAGQLCKIDVEDGTTVVVRDGAGSPAIPRRGSGIYFSTRVQRSGDGDPFAWELRHAHPEDGPSSLIATIDSRRSPFSRRYSMHGQLSPDGTFLALPLTDGETTNLWLVPVDGGPPRPVTDFGSRATLIVRWASWTPDGRHLVAAVAETDVDIVSFDGLL